jgi:hypothetical protein
MANAQRNDAVGAEPASNDPQIELGLNAAIVRVRDQQPDILVAKPGTAGPGTGDALPFGPFAPRAHRTLEIGLREWVKRQTGIELGYVEQLYTFGDRGRHAEPGGAHTLSVGYLALTRGAVEEMMGAHWSHWYAYFPWEDWRNGKPEILANEIEPRLKEWAERPSRPDESARPLGSEPMEGRIGARSPDGARPPADSRHCHGPPARQAEISTGRVRALAAGLHPI